MGANSLFAAPKKPKSMITYQATEKLKELESEKFSCKISSHKFDKDSGTGAIIFKE